MKNPSPVTGFQPLVFCSFIPGALPQAGMGRAVGATACERAMVPGLKAARRSLKFENSPAIYGWVKRKTNHKVPLGTKENAFVQFVLKKHGHDSKAGMLD
jgi:hypothetical protein